MEMNFLVLMDTKSAVLPLPPHPLADESVAAGIFYSIRAIGSRRMMILSAQQVGHNVTHHIHLASLSVYARLFQMFHSHSDSRLTIPMNILASAWNAASTSRLLRLLHCQFRAHRHYPTRHHHHHLSLRLHRRLLGAT